MDLYIDRDELSRGLARVQGIIEKRSTYPILSHVLLFAHEGGLRITATDTEVAYIGELAANVQKPGELAVDAANLFQIVRALPEPTVRLQAAPSNRLDVSCGRAQFRIPGHAAQEYPSVAPFDGRGVARMTEGQLRRLVEQTSFAVATDDVRYGLNGAYMEERDAGDGRMLRMVATDGHRLSAAETPFEGEIALSPRMLVPRKALAVIRKLLEGHDETVEIAFGDGSIKITRPGQTFWFRLLDGEFPDYDRVVPAQGSCKHRAMVGREELLSTLKRVSILVADRARAVRFALRDGELEIQVQNVDRGEITETVPIELEGDSVVCGFNVRYLQDILGVMTGTQVRMELAHPLAPCLVSDPERKDAFFVVMPMRLD
jgi:DNA polymerase-3 subunit beta